jgi:TatD DNase family protein
VLDSHCHLAGEEFAADLDEVVGRASDAGVTTALCILAAEDALELARAPVVRAAWGDRLRCATGIHPHRAGVFSGDMARVAPTVEEAIAACGACAIGEIGLDYHYDFSPRDVQQEVFREQLRLARRRDLPVIIHTREATDDTFAILEEEGGRDLRGVFHCFTGDVEMAKRALSIDFYLSYAGILTFPKAESLRDAARITPLDRLLSETDSPFLAPVPFRGKRNEPAYVTKVVDRLADLHGHSPASITERIAANFSRLFGA